ncbi:MAG: SBBP repeat-containing protein [Saprospiraceae bacterium]|nr:SBBP repeat-containing protein [Saprospiraceae bacterium]
MKEFKIIILLIMCGVMGQLVAQDPNLIWAKQLGGASLDEGHSIIVDANGNVYTTGYFQGTSDFDPGPAIYNLTSNSGSYDIFISKLDASGNFLWAKRLGGANEDGGLSISIDLNGNVYTTGYFNGTVDFDPGPGIFNLIVTGNNGYSDIFISKLDASGNFLWAKQMVGQGEGGDRSFKIAIDDFGNVYTTGYFNGTVDFDPGPGIFNLVNGNNPSEIFISKLNSTGNFLWAKKIGSIDWYAFGITLDKNGNVYTTGFFTGEVDFDPGPGTFKLTSAGRDIFVLKLDISGNFLWAKKMGGSFLAAGLSICCDINGNSYTTGYFQGTVDFDPGPSTNNLINVGTNDNCFITKLNPAGQLVWVKQLGAVNQVQGHSIIADASGNVYTTGLFSGTSDFNPGSGTFTMTAGGWDAFISKLDASGNFLWAKQLGGGNSDIAYSIALDKIGNIYTTGIFYGTSDFDPGPSNFNLISRGDFDIFIVKLSQLPVQPLYITIGTITGLQCFNDCNGTIKGNNITGGRGPFRYEWKLQPANNVVSNLLDPNNLCAGKYKLSITDLGNGNNVITSNEVTINFTPLIISTQPQNQSTIIGGSATFTVEASGTPPFTYQWKRNGVNFKEATSSSLKFANLQLANNGEFYSCLITNCGGNNAILSNNATLSVASCKHVSIVTQPTNQTASFGATATFTVVVSGSLPFKYQWKRNGVNINGAISDTYTTPPFKIQDDGSNYSCTISNCNGSYSINSKTATLKFGPCIGVTITTQPKNQSVYLGSTATYSVSVKGTGPFTYQWRNKGIPILGSNRDIYITPALNASDEGNFYSCFIKNCNGDISTISSNAFLSVIIPTINLVSADIPLWVRENEAAGFSGAVTVLTEKPARAYWHLEIDVLDSDGKILLQSPIIYPSINSPTQNFSSSDLQLATNYKSGRKFVFYAVLDSNKKRLNAGSMNVIDKVWIAKNVVYYNFPDRAIKIPLRYFQNTAKITGRFNRVDGASSENDQLNDITITAGDKQYLTLNYSDLHNLNPGVFSCEIRIYHENQIYIEIAVFDFTKIGKLGDDTNNDTLIVLIGGNRNSIESNILNLGTDPNGSPNKSFSIAENFKYGNSKTSNVNANYNTWYIAQSNTNNIDKNAYDLGISLDSIITNLKIANGPARFHLFLLAHSKGGLEVRSMLSNRGVSLDNTNYFIFDEKTVYNYYLKDLLDGVIFLATPHKGVGGAFLGGAGNASSELALNSNFLNTLQSSILLSSSKTKYLNITGNDLYADPNLSLIDGLVPVTSSEKPVLNNTISSFVPIQQYVNKNVPFFIPIDFGLHTVIHHTNILNTAFCCNSINSVLSKIFLFIRDKLNTSCESVYGTEETTYLFNTPNEISFNSSSHLNEENKSMHYIEGLSKLMFKENILSSTLDPRINIIPNPAYDITIVYLEGFRAGPKNLSLFNPYGRLVYNKKIYPEQKSFELDIKSMGLQAGIHFVQVIDENNQVTEKLVIQR